MLQFIGLMEENREKLRVSKKLLNSTRTGQFFLFKHKVPLFSYIIKFSNLQEVTKEKMANFVLQLPNNLRLRSFTISSSSSNGIHAPSLFHLSV